MSMSVCEVCGNDYWMSFQVRTVSGETHIFDSIECAAQRLAPICEHCQCRILGHGVEVDGHMFCCAHCAHQSDLANVSQIRDSAGAHPTAVG
jgi:phage terminase large subunit GpA-like protein